MVFLVKDNNTYYNCENSSLWAYSIISIIIIYFNNELVKFFNYNHQYEVFYGFTLLGIINLGLVIWGGIELFEKSCSNMYKTNLHNLSFGVFLFQLIISIICFMPIIFWSINNTISYIEDIYEDDYSDNDIKSEKESNIINVDDYESSDYSNPNLSPLMLDISSPMFIDSPNNFYSNDEIKSADSQKTVKVVYTDEDRFRKIEI